MGLQGIDISEYQGDVDFAKVKAAGTSFAYAKATEGRTWSDEKFGTYHDAAKAHGVSFGAYHFFHFNVNPVVQANLFLKTIDGRHGDLLPMVDVETPSDAAMTLGERVKVLGAFLDVVEESLAGKRCIIYTGLSFWNTEMGGSDAFSGHPLWIAEYNSNAFPELPRGWKSWMIWQHTSSATVPGIETHVDLDILNGNDLSLIRR